MATRLIRGLQNLPPSLKQGCVVTIGNYDGIHRGHQALLQQLKARAETLSVPSVVITFEPQPLEFFSKDRSVPRLTRFREKFYHIAQCGIDYVLVIRFNDLFASLSAEAFADKILHKAMQVKHMIVGDDFHFGHKRQGDVHTLQTLGQRFGFIVEQMHSVMVDHERISSTRIRKALQEDQHSLVLQLLGRPYSMMGRVVYGHQRGRMIGFPTANIYLHREATPVLGVYVVRLHGIETQGLPGVANVGVRPTVGGTRTVLEVHIFDFDQMIYGREVRVEFCKKLRDEQRFATLDLLKEQIWQDAAKARDYFENDKIKS